MFQWFRLAGLVLDILLTVCVGISWSPSDLRRHDEMRFSAAAAKESRTERGSSVVRVQILSGNETVKQELFSESLRLCNIVSLAGYTIIGHKFFDVYNSQIAVILAMLHFNDKIDAIVPELTTNPAVKNCDVKLTVDFYDNMMSPMVASNVFFEKILQQDHTLTTPQPCGIVGAGVSSISSQISVVSSVFDIPMISAVSMSSELDNKDIHPLFGRVMPVDMGAAVAAASYFKHFLNVTHCGVLYVDDNWGRDTNRLFTREARSYDVPMVVSSVSFDAKATPESIIKALEQLIETGFNYVFAAASPKSFESILSLGHKTGAIGPGRYWLFSPVSSTILRKGFKFGPEQYDAARGADGVGVINHNIPLKDTFLEAWRAFENETALMDYFVAKQPLHLNFSEFEFQHTPLFWYQFFYDAVIALGMAACQTKNDFFSAHELYDAFKRVKFTGATGRVTINSETGSRDFAQVSYKVTNIFARKPNSSSEVFLDARDVARQKIGGKQGMNWFQTNTLVFAGNTSARPPNLPSAAVTIVKIRPGVLGFGLCLGIMNMLEAAFWLIWTFRFRNTRVVRHGQPEFLYLLCFGAFVMASTVIPLSLQEPVSQAGLDVSCMAAPWLFQIGFVVSFSSLLAKMKRVNKIFLSQSFRRVVVRPRHVLAVPLLCMLVVSMVFLIAWTVSNPLTRQMVVLSHDKFGRPVQFYRTCTVQNVAGILPFVIPLGIMNIGLVSFANCQAYQVRRIRCEISERWYIAISMASILQAFVLGIPVLVAVLAVGGPSGIFLVTTILVTIVCSAVLLPLFLPKALSVTRASVQREPPRRIRTARQSMRGPHRRPPCSWKIAVSRGGGNESERPAFFARRQEFR